MKKIVLLCLFTRSILNLYAQDGANSDFPVIGKKCPDFILNQVQYSDKTQISLQDVSSKSMILDFFSLGCTSCFASFPKVNKLNSEFRDELQIILVGQDSKERGKMLRNAYEKYKGKYSLNLPVAYDSAIFQKFKIGGVPHLVWIDKSGIVKAISSSSDLTKENIEAFLTGKDFVFDDNSWESQETRKNVFDIKKPFLVNGNGGSDSVFLQRSLLAQWKKGMPAGGSAEIRNYRRLHNYYKNEKINYPMQILAWPLINLYRFAYFGQLADWSKEGLDTSGGMMYANYSYSPILEVKDKSLFEFEWGSEKNKFCYSLVLPMDKNTNFQIMTVMQRDLQNFFGYDVKIETRKMPVLYLISTEETRKRLLTKGDPSNVIGNPGTISIMNNTIDHLISAIVYNASLVAKDLPVLDKTEIKDRIDITIEGVLTDIEEVKKALHLKGLDLIPGEKEMKVIVIRDPKK